METNFDQALPVDNDPRSEGVVNELKGNKGNMMDKSKLVQMRLQPKTLARIEHLSSLTNTTNKTQLVSTAIELAENLIASVKDGAKIYIENKDGSKEVLKIIGI